MSRVGEGTYQLTSCCATAALCTQHQYLSSHSWRRTHLGHGGNDFDSRPLPTRYLDHHLGRRDLRDLELPLREEPTRVGPVLDVHHRRIREQRSGDDPARRQLVRAFGGFGLCDGLPRCIERCLEHGAVVVEGREREIRSGEGPS